MFLKILYKKVPVKIRGKIYSLFLGKWLKHYRKTSVSLYFHNRAWRKLNKHNKTYLCGNYPFDLISVGNFSYGNLRLNFFTDKERLIIGNYCSIAKGVTFVSGGNHFTDRLSTFPMGSILPPPYTGKTTVIQKGQ